VKVYRRAEARRREGVSSLARRASIRSSVELMPSPRDIPFAFR